QSARAPRAHRALIGVSRGLDARLEPLALAGLGRLEPAPRPVEFRLLFRERRPLFSVAPFGSGAGLFGAVERSTLRAWLRLDARDFWLCGPCVPRRFRGLLVFGTRP